MKRHRKRRQVNPWEVRRASLRALGFADYREYLASDLWRKIRAKVFATKGKGCSFCDGEAAQIHHNDYKLNTMRGKNINPLLPVCPDCHDRGSKSSEGWILRPRSATRKMRRQVPPGQVKHVFESRLGSALCGFCDRPEGDHAGRSRARPKRRRPKRVISPEEKLRRKKAKYERMAARVLKERGETIPPFDEYPWRGAKRSRKKQKQALEIVEGQAILDAIDARAKETARKHRARVLEVAGRVTTNDSPEGQKEGKTMAIRKNLRGRVVYAVVPLESGEKLPERLYLANDLRQISDALDADEWVDEVLNATRETLDANNEILKQAVLDYLPQAQATGLLHLFEVRIAEEASDA